jgi:hypothetical protein
MLKKIFQHSKLANVSALSVNIDVPDNIISETVIKRNLHRDAIDHDPTEIYDRARQIYFRAKRVRHSRSVSIL